MLVVMLPILVAIALCVYLTARIKRRRVRGIQAEIEAGGFVMDSKPDAARKDAVFVPMADIQYRLNLRNGAAGIQWFALRLGKPWSMCIIDHSYFTGSGNTTRELIHTVAVWWVLEWTTGAVSAFRHHWLKRIALTRGAAVIRLGDAPFDRGWVILGDEVSAKVLLTDGMRAMLVDSPKGESWHTGAGWIACAFEGALDAKNLLGYIACVARSGLAETTQHA